MTYRDIDKSIRNVRKIPEKPRIKQCLDALDRGFLIKCQHGPSQHLEMNVGPISPIPEGPRTPNILVLGGTVPEIFPENHFLAVFGPK